ncbi:putative NADH-ubiquinone reductase complex 1 MLRQ subunit [Plasmopara halstedii]
MKVTFARMRSMFGVLEQSEVPVTVPTGPRSKKGFMMVNSRDFEIYPLVICVSVAYAIGAFSLIRHAMWDPDVNGSRYRRETPAWERYKPEEGQAFSQNHRLFANLKPNPVNTFTNAFKNYKR